MSIKWSMFFLAFSGVLAYALIFLGQSQGDGAAPTAASDETTVASDPPASQIPAPAESEEIAATEVAVETEPAPEPVVETPSFENPWQAGVEAWRAGDMERAVTALSASVEERPQSAYRHYLLGLAFRRLDEPESAVIELDRSRELAPDAVKTLVALGRVHLDLEQTVEAREAVDRALELDLENGDTWHVLGRIELAEQNFDEAEAAFRRAVDHDPDHAWAWNNLGYLRIQREQFAAAADALRHAVDGDEPAAVFFNNLGVALERTDQLAAAAASYAKAGLLGSGPSEISFERVATVLDAQQVDYLTYDDVATLEREQLLAAVTPVNDDESELEVTEADSLDVESEELTQADLATESVGW